METTQIPTNCWVAKRSTVHRYEGVPVDRANRCSRTEPPKCYAKWKKAASKVTRRMISLTCPSGEGKTVRNKNNSVVARVEAWGWETGRRRAQEDFLKSWKYSIVWLCGGYVIIYTFVKIHRPVHMKELILLHLYYTSITWFLKFWVNFHCPDH